MVQKLRQYKGISLFIKLAIVGGCLYYIYHKIFNRSDFAGMSNELKAAFVKINLSDIFLLFIFMFFNWSLEAIKWRMIIRHLEPLSFFRSLSAVLTGVTVSVFTPNRAGEFGGRIFFLEHENRLQGILLTFLGNSAQLLITILTGALALLFYLSGYTDINEKQNPYLFFTFVIMVVLMSIALLLAYFNVSFISSLTRRIKVLARFQYYIDALDEYSGAELAKIILLSLLRYVIFTAQFFFLLRLFNVNINVKEGLTMIALTFFAITAIPTITVTELGIRGSAALAFIGLLSGNNLGIVTASFALWIINIAIPAIAGSVFVFRLDLFKSKI
ncbi:MAG: flippase-like domain-containing protein [Bacteroidetes bacterium]|nr:flippase-like domain-containing protein [Bacteroidota bacterium]